MQLLQAATPHLKIMSARPRLHPVHAERLEAFLALRRAEIQVLQQLLLRPVGPGGYCCSPATQERTQAARQQNSFVGCRRLEAYCACPLQHCKRVSGLGQNPKTQNLKSSTCKVAPSAVQRPLVSSQRGPPSWGRGRRGVLWRRCCFCCCPAAGGHPPGRPPGGPPRGRVW